MIFKDSRGISGEGTFRVTAGSAKQIRITPISSVILPGSPTLAMVQILDRLGNPISPDLHTMRARVTGGYIIDATGTRRTDMQLDIAESQIPFMIGSDTP